MRFSSYSPALVSLILVFTIFIYYTAEVKTFKTKTIKSQVIQQQKVIKKLINVKDKKAKFRNLVIPAVNLVYDELDLQYKKILTLIENNTTTEKITKLKQTYKVDTNEELLMALKPHPKSIAITQAAIESAWLTSRFYKEANNIFGVWSVNKNEPRIAASQKRGDKIIWLKKYASIEDSIRDYYKTLARSGAYKEFRELKMQTNNPYELVKKLDKYSEIGEKYCDELSVIIRYNKFYEFDK